MSQTTGTGAKKIQDTDNWRDIFDIHNDTVDAYDGKIGTTALPTTAQTLTGAVAEHETDITGVNNKIGSTALPTTAQTLTGAIDEHESDISALNSNLTNSFTNNNGGLCVLKYEAHGVSELPNAYSDGITFMNLGDETQYPLNYSLLITFKLGFIGRIAQIIVRYTGEAQIRSADNQTWGGWRTLA